MKVFVKLEYVSNIIRQMKRPFWRCYDGQSKLLIDTCGYADISIEDSVKLLEDSVNQFSGVFCLVRVYESKPLKNGEDKTVSQGKNYEYLIELNNQTAAQAPATQPQNNTAFMEKYLEKISDLQVQLIKQNSDFQLEKMQKQFDELKAEKTVSGTDGFDKLTGFLEKGLTIYMATQAKKNNPNPPVQMQPVSATQTAQQKPAGIFGTPDEKDKFSELVRRWAKADPNFISALGSIVWYAENENSQYQFYMNTLKNATNEN